MALRKIGLTAPLSCIILMVNVTVYLLASRLYFWNK